MTSLGMAMPPILSGLSLSRAVQTRVSAPSTASSSPMVSRCSTSKLERRNSVTREAISATSPNFTGFRKLARASTSGMPMMSKVSASSCAVTPSAVSNNIQVLMSNISKKRLLNTMPAGSHWPHSTVNCLRNVKDATRNTPGLLSHTIALLRELDSALARDRPFRHVLRFQFDPGGASASPQRMFGRDRLMRRRIDCLHQPVEMVRRDQPAHGRVARERERAGKRHHRFLAVVQIVFVGVSHREFARAAVNRIAPAQHGVVGLAYRAPQAALAKQRDDVILVARQRLDVHQPGRLAVIDECRDREDRRLRAMRGARLQHAARRHAGFAL